MNLNSLDANAVTQPGGLYASANQGILEALKAYFQFKDRQQQGERELRRDERVMGRQQLNDALAQAERYGVRPTAEQSGWMDPAKANPLLDAAVQKFTVADAQAAKDREMAALRDSVARIQAAEKLGPQGLPAGASVAEIQAAQRAAQERALSEKRQGVADQLGAVRLKAAQDEATWNSPMMRAGRGAAEWLGDTVQEAVKAAGRKSEKPSEWRPFGDSGMVGLRLEDGYTAVRFPGSDTPAQYLTPEGGMMTAEQYQKMKASLGQAVGVGVNPGVDSGAPAAQPRAWTQDKELDYWAGYEGEKIKGGTGMAAMRQWNNGKPAFAQHELLYRQTLPMSEQVALDRALSSPDFKTRAIASLKLHDDAKAWASTQRK